MYLGRRERGERGRERERLDSHERERGREVTLVSSIIHLTDMRSRLSNVKDTAQSTLIVTTLPSPLFTSTTERITRKLGKV